MDQFTQALQLAGADTTSIAYVKRVREVTRMTMMSSSPSDSKPAPQSTSSELLKGFSSLSSRLTAGFKEAGIGANLDNLISGVKNFLPVNKDLTLTKIVESIVDPQRADSTAIARTEHYLYFDPRSANARGTMPAAAKGQAQQSQGVSRGIEASFGQRRQGFNEAIVFVVGGGSLEEYNNLQSFAGRTAGGAGAQAAALAARRRIVYGSTEIQSARDFVDKELARLGKESM